MKFKIDTKDTFSTITPANGPIDAILTGELVEMCGKVRQSGSHNFIIDLQNCNAIDPEALNQLIAMHEDSYAAGQSLVFTGITDPVMSELKKTEADLLLNIAPKMIEAIDIISMEILERDLLSEE